VTSESPPAEVGVEAEELKSRSLSNLASWMNQRAVAASAFASGDTKAPATT